jgi:hypothetical protein
LNDRAAGPALREGSGSALDADGYIVVPTGLPSPVLEAVIDDIWRHAGSGAHVLTHSPPQAYRRAATPAPATVSGPRPGMERSPGGITPGAS